MNYRLASYLVRCDLVLSVYLYVCLSLCLCLSVCLPLYLSLSPLSLPPSLSPSPLSLPLYPSPPPPPSLCSPLYLIAASVSVCVSLSLSLAFSVSAPPPPTTSLSPSLSLPPSLSLSLSTPSLSLFPSLSHRRLSFYVCFSLILARFPCVNTPSPLHPHPPHAPFSDVISNHSVNHHHFPHGTPQEFSPWHWEHHKLQALVYILPSTTAVFSYAIGSRKLSANEQFFYFIFVGAQTVVGLLQTTQIKQGVSFIAANKVYTITNKTTIVWIEKELFFSLFFYSRWMLLLSTWVLGRQVDELMLNVLRCHLTY